MIGIIIFKNFTPLIKTNFDKTLQVLKDYKRLLKVGLFLRRFRINELPQFFNVLNGNMPIIETKLYMVGRYIYYSSLFERKGNRI